VDADVHELVRDAAVRFLRGDLSVVDLTYAFRTAVGQVAEARPLHGLEVDLFYELERWEESDWRDRPASVDRLRELAASIVALRFRST